MTEIKFLNAPKGSDTTFNLPIERIILLSESPIPNGKIAMREVDEAHLLYLIDVETELLPPITVALIEEGAILVDGRHRYERALRKGETSIAAKAPNYNSSYEVLNDAFASNIMDHLPFSAITKTAYGIWLHITANENGETMSIREAARKARISHTALLKAMKKLQNEDTEKRNAVDKDLIQPDVVAKLGKALYNYFKEEYELFDDNMYTNNTETIRAKALANHFKNAKNVKKSIEMLQSLSRSMELASKLLSNNNT